MKFLSLLCFFIGLSILPLTTTAQKKVSEITLVYDAVITTADNQPKLADIFDGSTITIYISGALSRSEMLSALSSITTIYDATSGTAVLLNEVGGQKILIRMTAENWKEKNLQYENVVFKDTKETKTIAGYPCTKAVGTTKNGDIFTVYYTKSIILENANYNVQFKNIEGLPLAYEWLKGNQKIKYSVSTITMNPVPASKFDIPKTGYREMTYEESKQLGLK
jgi:GLPGLI family protein